MGAVGETHLFKKSYRYIVGRGKTGVISKEGQIPSYFWPLPVEQGFYFIPSHPRYIR